MFRPRRWLNVFCKSFVVFLSACQPSSSPCLLLKSSPRKRGFPLLRGKRETPCKKRSPHEKLFYALRARG
jgi:hypothetical protein